MTRARSSIRRLAWLIGVAACGGGTTQPVSPPAPPPPPPPPVGARLDLAPAEVRVLSDAASLRAFVIEGAAAAREYHVIFMSGSRVEGALTSLRFRAAATGAGASVAPRSTIDLSRSVGSVGRRSLGMRGVVGTFGRSVDPDLMPRIEEGFVRTEAHDGGAPRGSRPRESRTAARQASVPEVGDMMTFTAAGQPDGTPSCFNGTLLDGVVRSVGARFVLVEEPAVAGHLGQADYDEINAELDAFVAPAGEAYFGDPGDIDGNQRVIAFFNGQPNRRGVIGGFFSPLDLADPGTCPNSNEAEIVWVFGPDPDGAIGPPVSADFTKTIAPGLIAHEYQHLLNAEQRIVLGNSTYGAGDLEDHWLNEGMSHIGEEITGLYKIGGSTRSEYGYTELEARITEPNTFGVFFGINLFRAVEYLGAPSAISALDTRAQMVDSPTRGWAYLFLRWLADRYASASPPGIVPGSAEDVLFRELSTGGPTHMRGVDNILRAIGLVSGESPGWEDVLAQYFAAPAVDNAHTSLSSDVQFRTWNLPRLYEELEANPNFSGEYPLVPLEVAVGPSSSVTASFDLGASTAEYFRLHAEGASPDMLVELTALSGVDVPSSARARIIVVRTR